MSSSIQLWANDKIKEMFYDKILKDIFFLTQSVM